MQIPFWVDVDTVDNDADMQMISGYIAGSTNLGNGVVLVHRIANLRQKLAAMGIERTIPTAMIDDQIISVADMIPRFDDCASLHRKNRRAVGIGNVQTIVVGGILAGNTDILAFAKERSDVLLPVWVIERIAEPAAGGRRIIINKRIVDLPQNRNAFTFFYFVEIDGQVMRIGIGIAFLLVIKLPDRVGKVVIAYIRKRENGVGVIFLYSYGLPAHLFLHRLGADFLGDGVGIIFCPVSLYLFRKVPIVFLSALSKGYILPIGATLLYLIPVVIAPAYLTGIHPLASVMGIYPHISEAAAAMVESLMQGVLFNTSPLVCVGSLLLIGATFAAASVVALKKQSY